MKIEDNTADEHKRVSGTSPEERSKPSCKTEECERCRNLPTKDELEGLDDQGAYYLLAKSSLLDCCPKCRNTVYERLYGEVRGLPKERWLPYSEFIQRIEIGTLVSGIIPCEHQIYHLFDRYDAEELRLLSQLFPELFYAYYRLNERLDGMSFLTKFFEKFGMEIQEL